MSEKRWREGRRDIRNLRVFSGRRTVTREGQFEERECERGRWKNTQRLGFAFHFKRLNYSNAMVNRSI